MDNLFGWIWEYPYGFREWMTLSRAIWVFTKRGHLARMDVMEMRSVLYIAGVEDKNGYAYTAKILREIALTAPWLYFDEETQSLLGHFDMEVPADPRQDTIFTVLDW